MQQLIHKIYTNPELGFVGQEPIYQKAKEINKHITRKDVKEFFDHFTTTQLHKPTPREHHLPIVGNLNSFQADLIFYPKYKRQNNGYQGAFIAVGINSRYAYGYPFKSKSAKDINAILEQFIKDVKEDGKEISILETDNGAEFVSKSAQKIFQQANINHFTHQPGDHYALGKIDAFSRTIKRRIAKYMTNYNTVKWVDVFPEMIYNYNHTVHSSIRMEPANVTPEIEKQILNEAVQKYKNIKKQDIRIGDVVRLPIAKGKFDKEGQTYSSDLYTVSDVGPSKIAVRNSNGNLMRTKYNRNSVLKVPLHSGHVDTTAITQAKKEAKVHRVLQKEGLDTNSIRPRQKRESALRSSIAGNRRLPL